MKNWIALVVLSASTIIGAVLAYLFGAFCAASFDISTWSDWLRFLVAVGLCGGAAGGFIAGCWVVSL